MSQWVETKNLVDNGQVQVLQKKFMEDGQIKREWYEIMPNKLTASELLVLRDELHNL